MTDQAAVKKAPHKATTWRQDPEGVRRAILDAARVEFAEKGLSGSRVDEIAARTSTAKRMIYYYFGDKEGLYIAVLEAAYGRMRAAEVSLDLATMSPVEALAKLAGLAFDYHAANPDFVRLVMVENIHRARHLRLSKVIGELNLSAIRTVREIYDRAWRKGCSVRGLTPSTSISPLPRLPSTMSRTAQPSARFLAMIWARPRPSNAAARA